MGREAKGKDSEVTSMTTGNKKQTIRPDYLVSEQSTEGILGSYRTNW